MLYPFTLIILVSSIFFRPTFEPLAVISNVQRAKFQGMKVPGSKSSIELSFLGAKVPGNESSTLWNFRSRERKFFGTKVPATVNMTFLGL